VRYYLIRISRFAKLLKTTLFDLTISFPILDSLTLKTTREKTKHKRGRGREREATRSLEVLENDPTGDLTLLHAFVNYTSERDC